MKHLALLFVSLMGLSLASASSAPAAASSASSAPAAALSADGKTPQQKYIDKYADLAVKEMRRTGIPASITLAQGLLESGCGQSELAVRGNNHFGIKCHSGWKGPKMRMDDDEKNECFRKYRTVEQSYHDHSDFLVYRDRYRFLFDLDKKDYEGWAYGLKKAGYATDPAYPKKLISIIEEYELYKYDGGKRLIKTQQEREAAQAARAAVELEQEAAKQAKAAAKLERKAQREAKRSAKAAEKAAKNATKAVENKKGSDATADRPSEARSSEATLPSTQETFSFSLSRQKYSSNGVPFVYSSKGDTYSSIAQANNLFLREILRFNDLDSNKSLLPGTIVYLQPKKKQASKGLDKHIVDSSSETLYDIAQRYAITLKSLCKLNDLTPDHKLREGEEVHLRKGR